MHDKNKCEIVLQDIQWINIAESGINISNSTDDQTCEGLAGLINGCVIGIVLASPLFASGFGYTVFAFGPTFSNRYQECKDIETGKELVYTRLCRWIEEALSKNATPILLPISKPNREIICNTGLLH